MPSLYSQRTAFERDCLRALRPAAKGTGWTKVRESLIRQVDDLFLYASLRCQRNALRTVATFYAKPMSLDPTLWEILGMPENRKEPLSLRAHGAFVGRAPDLFEAEIEVRSNRPEQIADAFVAFVIGHESEALKILRARSFADILRSNVHHIERGAYAVELVTALICEGKRTEARALAAAHASGSASSTGGFTVGGRDFHELAVRWIDTHSEEGVERENRDHPENDNGYAGIVLTLERSEDISAPTAPQIAVAVSRLTPRGGPSFAILQRRKDDYVQCAGGDGTFTVEWRDHVDGTFRHWVAGKGPEESEELVQVATNGADVSVQRHERLATDDVTRLFLAFAAGHERPSEFTWRDVTDRFHEPAVSCPPETPATAHPVTNLDRRKPSLVTDDFRRRLERLLAPRGFATRAGGAKFVRKRGKNTHRIELSSSHYNPEGSVSCFVSLLFVDGVVAKRLPGWRAGGLFGDSDFGETPPKNIARAEDADALFALVSERLAFFDFMEDVDAVFTHVRRRYVPGFLDPGPIASYLEAHLGAAAVHAYATSLLGARPELWPAFAGAVDRGEARAALGRLVDHGTALAGALTVAAGTAAIEQPPGVVLSNDPRGAWCRSFLGLQLRAWGEPEAAGELRHVGDSDVLAVSNAQDALPGSLVDSVQAASLVLRVATGEQRRPRRQVPSPRLFQYPAKHAPFA